MVLNAQSHERIVLPAATTVSDSTKLRRQHIFPFGAR
jgi:hypothetical protein